MDDQLWSIQDLMDYFKMSRPKVDRLRASEGFPPEIRLPGNTYPRYEQEAIKAWARSFRAAA